MSNLNARFIWNTRFFHIAKAGEQLSNFAVAGEYVKDLVEYCGTRETVALNIAKELKDAPATEKQINLIRELCRSAPNHKTTLEYADYTKAPTVQNASELIAVLSEEVMMNGGFDEASNLVEYAAKRPGAVIVGSHGLFSDSDNVDLKKAQEEISAHKGNIWTHVLSLRREDADRLGFDGQTSWKNLIKGELALLAETHKIKLENLQWYGAMHNTGNHPHVHLFVFSKNPNEGFFSNKGKTNSIEKCKRAFASKIFKAELENEYVAKNEYREELKKESSQLLQQLSANPLNFSEESRNKLINSMLTLSKSIDHNKNVKYGYLSPELKQLVDEIQKTLVYENKELSQLYLNWCKHQFNIEKIYVQEPKDIPIESNKEFIPIKNEIIRQAQSLDFLNSDIDINIQDTDSLYNSKITDKLYPTSESKKMSDKEIFEELNFYSSPKYRDGDTCCKLGDCYFYGKGTEKDITKAMMWYSISAEQYQNGVAGYRLGDIYKYGATEIETDKTLADYYYKNAFYSMKNNIINHSAVDDIFTKGTAKYYEEGVSKTESYKEYLLGCMFYEGKGVEKSYEKAFNTFLLSASSGNERATFQVGQMLLQGKGTEKDTDTGLDIMEKLAIESRNPNAAYIVYKNLEKNIECPKTKKMMFLHIASDGGNANALCKLGAISYSKGDTEKAIEYFEKAASKNSAEAFRCLGDIYNNKADSESYKKGQSYYSKALYEYLQDYNKNPKRYTAFRIAQMYHYGKGVDCDTQEAEKWYKKASKGTNNELNTNHNEKLYTQHSDNLKLSVASCTRGIINTVTRAGKMLSNSTQNSAKNRHALTDKKLAREMKKKKLDAGHAVDDKDYDYS